MCRLSRPKSFAVLLAAASPALGAAVIEVGRMRTYSGDAFVTA
ncbi:hypothetical protein [Kitasatospora sp. DSM 101779]|nr:hypothetical protein [Kitasatospora sp. DSM 101779]